MPKIAIGAFMLESNAHSPVSTREEFAANVLLDKAALTADLREAAPRSPGCLVGFVHDMDTSGAWTPAPLCAAAVGASGPIDQGFFNEVVETTCAELRKALPVDAVFISLHGAAIATGEADPDGYLLERVRAVVGPGVPVAATLDLHGNIVPRMVANADYLAAYLTNPHVDMRARGAECAQALRAMLATGARPHRAFVKLPFIPPSVTQNTKSGPYGDLIAFGQTRRDADVLNVSVLSGFTLGDTPKAGMSVIVAARSAAAASAAAEAVARKAWSERARYVPHLTSLEAATKMAVEAGNDLSKPPLLFADVADNAGGGGRANTVWILEAFHKAGVQGCALGIFYDAPLAAEAHRLGVGGQFIAQFNRAETHPLSGTFAAPATVRALHGGTVVGRRGISAGLTISLGPTALLDFGGIQVVVVSVRQQCKDTVFFEMVGVDIAAQRSLIVKSRGHFRAAFDQHFPDDRIIEVDVPGLTTPVLSKVPFRHIPRPIYPIDADLAWDVPAPTLFPPIG